MTRKKKRKPEEIKPVRLLTIEGERKVWRTFQAQCLVGTMWPGGRLFAGGWPDSHKSAADGPAYLQRWAVFRGAGGKLAVFHYSISDDDEAGVLRLYDSFEAMRGAVPDDIVEEAEIAAGVRPEPADPYAEEPLEL